MFFNGTIFLEEEFFWNVKRLRELFRVHLDLSLTMWTECEEFVSLNEDPYCFFDLLKTVNYFARLVSKTLISMVKSWSI